MDIDFRDAAARGELSNFALAQLVHQRIGYADPFLAFDNTLALVVPDMAQLGTDRSLDLILKALSPDTRNINLEDVIVLPIKPEGDIVRTALATTQSRDPSHPMSRKDFVDILNKLARLGETEPASVKKAGKGDIYNMPLAADEAGRAKEIIELGIAFKRDTHFLLVRELQRLIFDDRGPVDAKMQIATFELPRRLVDGDRIQRAVYEVMDHFASVGDFVRRGFTVGEAVVVRKRQQLQWSQAAAAKQDTL